MSLFLDRALAGADQASADAWRSDAAEHFPLEAAEVDRLNRELLQLPKDAPTSRAVDLYEQLLAARERLYEVWIITRGMDK